jgi:hypothetical protein
MNWFHAPEARLAVNLSNVTLVKHTAAGLTVFFCDDSDPIHLSNGDAAALWPIVSQPTAPPEMALLQAGWPVTSPIYDGPEYHTTEQTPIEALGEPPADAAQVKP